MQKIFLVGIGMGNLDTLTEQGRLAIEKSDLLIGAERMLDSFPQAKGVKYHAIDPVRIMEYIAANPDYTTVSVIFSGDVGFYSGAKKLNQLIGEQNESATGGNYEVEFIPGISSLQYFCAKLKLSWEDTKIVSLHGREGNVMGAVWNYPQTFFLTGGDYSVQRVCQLLVENDLGEALVHVGERLSYPEERVISAQAEVLTGQVFHPLSVMMVINQKLLQKNITTHGIEDRWFVRGQAPMTKSEIRSVSLSKLQLQPGDVVYDIGAGTGAVSVDMAFQVYEGCVYAIETKEEAVALIKANSEKLGAWNVKVISGHAPEALVDLPAPDRVFIGGSSGNMAAILELLAEKNPMVRVVINAITLETLAETLDCLRKLGFEDIEIVQISAARSQELGRYHMMVGLNPVFIISGQKGEGRWSNG